MRPTPFTQPTWPSPAAWSGEPQGPNVVYGSPVESESWWKRLLNPLRELARLLIINTNESPIHAPPFRARALTTATRIVVAPVAGDAVATAGAVALAAAEGTTVVTPTASTSFVTVLTYTIPQGFRARINGAGVYIANAAHNLYRWRIVAGGEIISDSIQWGLADSMQFLDVFNIPAPTKNVEIQVQNQDPDSGILVEARLNGWIFPVLQNDDTLQSLMLTNGFESNGRFTPNSGNSNCPPPGPIQTNCPQ